MMLPTFKVDLPILIKVYQFSQGNTQRFISKVNVESVRLSINTNYYRVIRKGLEFGFRSILVQSSS